jgi:inosine-uridine nucleoside N-ribohydrolase
MGADEIKRLHDPAWSMNHRCFAEPEEAADKAEDDGVGLIIRTLMASPEPATLCCIAPLTNIASALAREPAIAGRIERILLMGGETALNRAEHNIAFDAVASDIVLNAGVPLVMGTWDVTRRFVLGAEDLARFAASPLPLHQTLSRAITAWHPAQSWKPGPVMYDLFPFVQAFDPSYYTLAETRIQVPIDGHARGMTCQRRGVAVQVTNGVRAELRQLYSLLLRGRLSWSLVAGFCAPRCLVRHRNGRRLAGAVPSR